MRQLGGVPAISGDKIQLSMSNRGCFGGCSFCALTFHQGRIIQTRSHESIVEEAKLLTQEPDFKGYIHDVGGPTADFRVRACQKQLTRGVCPNRQCLFPEALQEPSGRSRGLSGAAAQAPGASEGEESLHPFRYPFRLCAGRSRRYLFPGAGVSIMSAAS